MLTPSLTQGDVGCSQVTRNGGQTLASLEWTLDVHLGTVTVGTRHFHMSDLIQTDSAATR